MNDLFVVFNLNETYPELGNFGFKVVLSPSLFKSCQLSTITLCDSDGRPMELEVNRWGRKLNCVFTIREDTADGVALAKMKLVDSRGRHHDARLSWWVIKP